MFSYLRTLDNSTRLSPSVRTDVYIALLIFIFGFAVSAFLIALNKPTNSFYQREFAPAVLMACGGEFINVKNEGNNKALFDFLALKTDKIDCNEIDLEINHIKPSNLQVVHRYLLEIVSSVWKLTSISWSGLWPLMSAFYAVTCLVSYLIFRLGTGHFLAIVGSLIMCFSFWQFQILPHLRDYSKAPFMLGALLLCAYIVKTDNKTHQKIYTVLLGGVIGYGLGIRFDILLFFPFVLATLLFFTKYKAGRKGICDRLTLVTIFLSISSILGWPIISNLVGGQGNTFHVMLLGLAPPMIDALGIEGGINFLPFYNDQYLLHSVSAWASQGDVRFDLATAEYETAAANYWLQIASFFPADFFLGGLASINKMLFFSYEYSTDVFQSIAYPKLIGNLENWQRYFIIITVILGSLFSYRSSLQIPFFLIFSVSYILASTFLQFSTRHYFYLEIVSFWFILVFIQYIISYLFNGKLFFLIKDLKKRDFKNLTIVLLSITALPFVILHSLRFYQEIRTKNLQEKYLDLELQKAPIKVFENKTSSFLQFNWDEFSKDQKRNFAYLVLDTKKCSHKWASFSVNYDAKSSYYNFSQSIFLSTFLGSRYFIPVFNWGEDFKFNGISLFKDKSSCFSKLRVVKPKQKLPLLLTVNIPSNKDELEPFENYRFKPIKKASVKVSMITNTEFNISPFFESYTKPFEEIEAFPFSDPIMEKDNRGIHFNGQPSSHTAYIVSFGKNDTKDRYLRLEGELSEGRVNLGLLNKEDSWHWLSPISQVGPYRALIRVPAGFTPIIAANMKPSQKMNLSVTRAHWLYE